MVCQKVLSEQSNTAQMFRENAQNDCESYLLGLELAYNIPKNEATTHSPFILLYGEHQFSLAYFSISDGSAISSEAVSKFVKETETTTSPTKASIEKPNSNSSGDCIQNRPKIDINVISSNYLPPVFR